MTRRAFLSVLPVAAVQGRAPQDSIYEAAATIIAADHEVDGTDIGWVELRFMGRHGAVSVGGDMDTPLMQWLAQHRGADKHLKVRLEAVGRSILDRLERVDAAYAEEIAK